MKVLAVIVGLSIGTAGLTAVAYMIWPLTVFNLLMPKDSAQVLVRDVAYGSHPKQRYDLYAPLQGTNHPLLVFVHGGSWSMGGKEGYDFVGYAFASRGYLTAMIEYRLVPDAHYPDFVSDTARAIAHLRSQAAKHGGDSSRVYLVGHSAGAYNVVQAAFSPAFAGEVKNVRAVAGMAGPYVFKADTHPDITKAFGRFTPFEDTQPDRFANKNSPAVILLHGLDDDIVQPESSIKFFELVKAAGATAELKLQPKTHHISILGDLSRPFRHRSTTFEDIINFFAKHP